MTNSDPGTALIAFAGPAGVPAKLLVVAGDGSARPEGARPGLAPLSLVPIALEPLAGADSEQVLRATVAALACDALCVVLPCAVGLDPATIELWRAAEDAGLPRAVLVTELAADAPDFADLAAIAARALGPECLPVRLPVWSDDDPPTPVASLGLADLTISGPDGIVAADPEHAQAAAEDRTTLVDLVAVLADDGFAAAVSAGITPSAVASSMRGPVLAGELAPVLPASADGAWATDLAALLSGISPDAGRWTSTPGDRLVRRDAAGEACGGSAAVVLAVADDGALVVREVFGTLPPGGGAVVVTASMPGVDGTAQPFRSWPTAIELLGGSRDGLVRVRSVLAARPGEALSDSQVWLTPVRA